MHTIKKTLIIATSLFLMLGFVACGKCEHEYESKITKDSTCTEEGEMTYTCKLCGNSYIQAIDVIEHSYDEALITKEPSCIEKGEKVFVCKICGGKISEEIGCSDHVYNSGTVIEAATCGSTGTKEYKCKVCGKTKTETIAATGKHKNTVIDSKNPTCTENGYKKYRCDICGREYTDTISATGHAYKDGANTATCISSGTITSVCTKCGDQQVKNTTALGHIWKNATCTEPKKCKICGATEGTALGHQYEGGACSICGASAYTIQINCPSELKYYEKVGLNYYYADFTVKNIKYTINKSRVNVAITYTPTRFHSNVHACIHIRVVGKDTGITVVDREVHFLHDLTVGSTYVDDFAFNLSDYDPGTYIVTIDDYIDID